MPASVIEIKLTEVSLINPKCNHLVPVSLSPIEKTKEPRVVNILERHSM